MLARDFLLCCFDRLKVELVQARKEMVGRMECGFDHWDFSFKSVKLGVGWTAINKKRAMFPRLQKVPVRGEK